MRWLFGEMLFVFLVVLIIVNVGWFFVDLFGFFDFIFVVIVDFLGELMWISGDLIVLRILLFIDFLLMV